MWNYLEVRLSWFREFQGPFLVRMKEEEARGRLGMTALEVRHLFWSQ